MVQRNLLTMDESVQLEKLKGRNVVRLLVIAMRPHQWVKNLFVLAPLLFAMKLFQLNAITSALMATATFCLLSSAIYLINDVVDAAADRAHPQKRLRPIASGELQVRLALGVSVVLLIFALSLAFTLGLQFGLLTVAYFVLMIGYCLVFKQAIVLDGMLIAAGFVLRVVSGAIAINATPTHWLIACAFLLALFLAFSKRRHELLNLADDAEQHRRVLGQYTVAYLDRVNSILLGATIVCYALYTVAPETVSRFGTDKLIYGTAFVIYGLLRYLALTQFEENGGNPSTLLVKDKPLLLTVLCWGIYNTLVIYRTVLELF